MTMEMNDEHQCCRKEQQLPVIRITIVGDRLTGKNSLLIAYKDKVYYDEATVIDTYSHNLEINGKMYQVSIQHTTGQEPFGRLRPLGYTMTDVFIICYSIEREDSYKNVKTHWAQEVRHCRPGCKIILVGTKADLRNSIENSVTYKNGLKLKSEIRADEFIECSSKNLQNIDDVFSAALTAAVNNSKSHRWQRYTCTLL